MNYQLPKNQISVDPAYQNPARSPSYYGAREIILCDAPAGAGKTYSLCRLAIDLARRGERVIFAQPTNALIDETAKYIAKFDGAVPHHVFNYTNMIGVVTGIIEHINSSDNEGQIVSITHESLERLPYVHNRDSWNVIIDEALQVHRGIDFPFAHSHSNLTNALKMVPIDDDWARLEVADIGLLNELKTKKRKDRSLNEFSEAIKMLESDNFSVFTSIEIYRNFTSGAYKSNYAPQLFAVLKPSILSRYKSVRIAGAMLRESLLVKIWESKGIKFRNEVLKELQYQTHPNGDQISIYYCIRPHWSQWLRKKHDDEVWQPIIQRVSGMCNNNEFIYMLNKKVISPFRGNKLAHRLPNLPHGLNSYKHIDFIAYLSAINPSPVYKTFLEWLGVDEDEIVQSTYYMAIYQAIMRGGIRDFKEARKQTVIVPDQRAAEWLQHIFPGSKVEWLGIKVPNEENLTGGRSRKYSDAAEKQLAYRIRKESKANTEEFYELLDEAQKYSNEDDSSLNLINLGICYESHYIDAGVTNFHGTIWESIYEKIPRGFLMASDHRSLIAKLKEFHCRKLMSKKSNQILTTGMPGYNLDGMRKEKNMLFANGIFLDRDCGVLTPQEFAEFFPELQMVIYNTYSSTLNEPRWRVYIPTETIMTREAYRNIVDKIFSIIESRGYNKDGSDCKLKHGFDYSKNSASSPMYLPCQAGDPSGSFFLEFFEQKRKPLDPRKWVDFSIHPQKIDPQVPRTVSRKPNSSNSDADIENLIEKWRLDDRPGHRYHGWSDFYFALVRLGVPSIAIDSIMTEEAYRCETPYLTAKRISQLKALQRL